MKCDLGNCSRRSFVAGFNGNTTGGCAELVQNTLELNITFNGNKAVIEGGETKNALGDGKRSIEALRSEDRILGLKVFNIVGLRRI